VAQEREHLTLECVARFPARPRAFRQVEQHARALALQHVRHLPRRLDRSFDEGCRLLDYACRAQVVGRDILRRRVSIHQPLSEQRANEH
jgi:hypothetical protein